MANAGTHVASNLTGALGKSGAGEEHGLIRFFKEQYSDNIRLKSMALKNTLGAFVTREVLNGAPLQLRSVKKVADFGPDVRDTDGAGGSDYTAGTESYQFLAGQAAQEGPRKNVARFTEFQYYAIPTEYRTVIPDFWDLPHAYDWRDKKALLRDAKPDSQMLKSALASFERGIDRYIIMAQDSDVLVNDAGDTTPGTTLTTYTADGGSSVDVLFANNEQTDEILTGRSLTTGKLREAKRILMENEAVMAGDPIICALHPRQISHLLQDPEVKSHDFNTVKPLADGQIISWMGMTLVPTTQIFPVDADQTLPAAVDPWATTANDGFTSTGRYVHCFTPDAIVLGADPVITEMDVIAHKRHLLQIVHYSAMGAIRMDGKKCVRIECVDGV